MKNVRGLVLVVILIAIAGGVYAYTQGIGQFSLVKGSYEIATTTESLTLMKDGKVVQTLTLSKNAQAAAKIIKGKGIFITNQDINFDGHTDIALLTGIGYGGVVNYYDYYIFSTSSEKFEKDAVLREVGNPELDVRNKTFIAHVRSGPYWYSTKYSFNGSGYVKGKEVRDVEQQSTSSQATSTSTWLTYSNPDLGISFKYPKEMGEIDVHQLSTSNVVSFKKGGLSFTVGVHYDQARNKNFTVDEWVNAEIKLLNSNTSLVHPVEKSDITVDGKKGVRLHYGDPISGGPTILIYIPLDTNGTMVEAYEFSRAIANTGGVGLSEILPTMKLTVPVGAVHEQTPIIQSITPALGPKGTIVEIKGTGLSGFEGDLNVYFERADGKRVLLKDTFGDYAKTQGTLIKVKVIEPCQQGETVYGDYSGIATQCNFVGLTPGTYKVYTEPWGVRSNVVSFTLTQ